MPTEDGLLAIHPHLPFYNCWTLPHGSKALAALSWFGSRVPLSGDTVGLSEPIV